MILGDIRIYNRDMELIAIIPQFLAANWDIKFSGYGTGEIEFVRTDELLTLLTQNKYLFLVQGDIQSIVTGYHIGKTCTVFTRTLEWLLTKFVVTEVTAGETLSGVVKNILSSLPDAFNLNFVGLDGDSTDMSGFAFDEAADIYSAVKKCITDVTVGFSLTADFKTKTFTFSLESAKENNGTLLCDEYKTSYDSEYTYDIQNDAAGGFYYHQLKYMGKYDVQTNSPALSEDPKYYGCYYIASSDGSRFGLTIKEGDIVACRSKQGDFEIISEAKPFLVEIAPDADGIFSWSVMLDAANEADADAALADKKPMDLLNMKTRLTYGTDYKIGDIITTKFYGRDIAISKKKLVSEVHLWVEREDSGASPTTIDI